MVSPYWAAEPGAKCASEVKKRLDETVARLRDSGRLEAIRSMLTEYYSLESAGRHHLAEVGDGEALAYRNNEVRPLVQQTLVLVAGERPKLKPVARHSDAKADAAARLADALLASYEKQLGFAQLEMQVLRGAILAHSWWCVATWDEGRGQPVQQTEDGRILYEGDVRFASVPPWRVACDRASTQRDRRWMAYVEPANVHELRALYPYAAEKLYAPGATSPSYGGDKASYSAAALEWGALGVVLGEVLGPDEVWLWELRHPPSPALPQGRLLRFTSPECIIYDSLEMGVPYPYVDAGLLAWQQAPERVVGTSDGHSPALDMLASQELVGTLTSALASNANLHAQPNYWLPRGGDEGSSLPVEALPGGGNLIRTASKPEAVEFPVLPAGLLQATEAVRGYMRESQAINNVVMGAPDKGMPAKMAALLRAQAVQFHAPTQAEYFGLVEWMASAWLALVKQFVRAPRTVALLGEAGAARLEEWRADSLSPVECFQVEPVNPVTRTYEGRLAQAEDLLAQGMLTREEYLSMLATGQPGTLWERATTQRSLIQRNKELLRAGTGLPPVDMAETQKALDAAVQAGEDPRLVAPVFDVSQSVQRHVMLMRTDPHWLAYPEYASVLDDASLRDNPDVVEAVTGVLTETLRLWYSLTADELKALGGPALPSQMMAAAAPPPAGEGSEDEGSAPPPDGPTEAQAAMPRPPPDPISGASRGPDALGGLA